MELVRSYKCELYEKGFALIPGVVPRKFTDRALGAINHRLSRTDMNSEGRNYDFMSDIGRSPEILDLYYKTPMAKMTESLIGSGQIEPIDRAQIALRFPGAKEPSDPPEWHLDGMYHSKYGAQTQPINHTLLVGIFLSDLPGPNCGNFTVHPGGHQILARYFRQRGIDALFDGILDVLMPPAEQLVCRSGDAVLCHHQLPHWGEPCNLSPHIRYTVFFRANRLSRSLWVKEAMTDLFIEWKGMHDFIRSYRNDERK